MNPNTDLGHVVTDWLRADASSSGSDVVLAATLVRVATVRQERRRLPWELPPIRPALKLAALSAAAIGIIAIATNLPSRNDGVVGRSTIPAQSPFGSPIGSPVATPDATAFTIPRVDKKAIDPGAFDMGWPLGPSDVRVRVTVPAGWARLGDENAFIYKDRGGYYGFPAEIQTHSVQRVVTSVCALDQPNEVGPILVAVGTTVDDLTRAISNVAGTHWSEPTDVTIGSFPAKRMESTFAADCDGPTRRTIWANDTSGFFVEEGARDTIYVVDVQGERLVITTEERNASGQLTDELQAMVDSIDIVRGQATGETPSPSPAPARTGRFPVWVGPDADLRVGRHQATVEGIPFSFAIPSSGWEPQRGFYISKSMRGPQDAEGTIRWTTLPNGLNTKACSQVLDDSANTSAADVASAVAGAPGVDVVSSPVDVTIGGRAGKHVVVDVRTDLGCDPGFFYSYQPVPGGALWFDTVPGDRILVWIVEVDGKLLFIEAELHAAAGPGLELEIRAIVDSMHFE